MKIKGSTILLIAAAVVIALLVAKIRQQNIRLETASKPSAIIDEAKTEAKKLATSVDQKGYRKTTFERKQAIIGNGDISKLPVSQSVIDSLRLDNIDKTNKLAEASAINATLQAKALRAEKKVDSLNRPYYSYNDGFGSFNFWPDSLGGKFGVNYKIKLLRHDYSSPKKLFKPRVNYTDILSPDPRVTIDGLQTLTIESPKPSRLGIGVFAGAQYNPFTKQLRPAYGAGLVFHLFPF